MPAADDPEVPGPTFHAACELCAADRYTHWYSVDDVCWVADCDACSTPMVVWRHHGIAPSDADVEHMLTQLRAAAAIRYEGDEFTIDRTMRQMPTHFHAHARVSGWWDRRWSEPVSRYTGVGGERVTGRTVGGTSRSD